MFLIYLSTWSSDFFIDVNQKFADIRVHQIFKGRFVIEKNLKNETEIGYGDKDEINEDNLMKLNQYSNTQADVNSDIPEESDEELVELISRSLKESLPKPLLAPDILKLHARMNLTDPGHMGLPVTLPAILEADIELMLNESKEIYQINEFVSNLIPLDRELPDIRTDYCKNMKYSDNLPMASIIMVFHNEALSMILRSLYAILKRSPDHLLKEIVLIDDCSDIGNYY